MEYRTEENVKNAGKQNDRLQSSRRIKIFLALYIFELGHGKQLDDKNIKGI